MKKLILYFALLLPIVSFGQGIINSSSMNAPTTSTPTISPSVSSLAAFTANTGTPPTAKTFTLNGSNLTAVGSLSCPAGYQASLDNSTFTNTLSFPITGTQFTGQPLTVYIRMTAVSAGTFSGNVSISSTGATTANIAVTGTVSTPTPGITVVGSFSAFNTSAGTASGVQTQTVSGANLTADVVITAPSPLQVSLDNSAFGSTKTITHSGTTLPGQPVTVYFKIPSSASAGTLAGNVQYTSTGATTQSFAVSGTISSPATGFIIYVNQWDSVGSIGKVVSSEWNNWGVTELNVATFTSQFFKDTAGTQRTIYATIGNINSNLDQGAGYNSGTTTGFPVLAFENAIYKDESSETFTIKGVPTNANHYLIKIMCSRATSTDRNVTFTVHGTAIAQTVNAKNNDTFVVLDGVDPDGSGNIQIDITDATGFWYLNFWTIQQK